MSAGGATVRLRPGVELGNARPLVLIGGVNVIESAGMAHEAAEHFVTVTRALGLPFVFKASFDKANRSSQRSFRGPGLERGLTILSDIRERFGCPILTDVHEPWQAAPVAAVADVLQIPAFLARQTDLVDAVAATGRAINVKKPQFLAPQEMVNVLDKCRAADNTQVMLCERGTAFGYNNLVVDMLGMDLMRAMAPVVFDVTHALQRPGARGDSADGRSAQALPLARAAVALGIAGLFLEAHATPERALCDGACAIPLDDVHDFLTAVMAVDRAVKLPGGNTVVRSRSSDPPDVARQTP